MDMAMGGEERVVDFERGDLGERCDDCSKACAAPPLLPAQVEQASKQHGPPPSHGAEQVAWYRMYDLVWYGMAW